MQVLSPTHDFVDLQAVPPCLRESSGWSACQGQCAAPTCDQPPAGGACPWDSSAVQPRQLTLLLLATHLGTGGEPPTPPHVCPRPPAAMVAALGMAVRVPTVMQGAPGGVHRIAHQPQADDLLLVSSQ